MGVTNDPPCKKYNIPGGIKPEQQREWNGAAKDPQNDKTAKSTWIYTTPMAADLNLDLDPKKIQPSIIVSTFTSANERTGMLRVFDGRTCEEQMRIGGPDDPDAANNRPTYAPQWAIGDLDGDVGTPDGHPEIVGFRRVGLSAGTDPGEVIAYGVDSSDPAKPKLVRRWVGRNCETNTTVKVSTNASTTAIGIGLHDLDDDGKPEVVVDRLVFDAEGCVLNPGTTAANLFSAVADVDLDGKPDLIRFNGVSGWDPAAKNWAAKPWSKAPTGITTGYIAIADVGHYSEIPGHPKTDPLPEIIVVGNGKVWVVTLTGDIVFGPFSVYDNTGLPAGDNKGGAPTAADFDGDGQVEFATAGATFYSVYDPDCVANPDAAARPGGTCSKSDNSLPEGILWAQPSQDKSSNVTGSSVFDFNGDGQAEVVYRDECFVRVYDGKTGKVLYSSPASSGTGFEYPIIADVDGDFATEIVVPRTAYNGCPKGPDKLFPNSGDFKASTGFVVLRDPEDRWVSSRPIWNQHAYSITNVTDDARIPKSSEVKRNWEQPGLNNFRQNAQGALGKLAIADLTVEIQDAEALCSGEAGTFPSRRRSATGAPTRCRTASPSNSSRPPTPTPPSRTPRPSARPSPPSSCSPANARSSSAPRISWAAAISTWMSTPRTRSRIATPATTSALTPSACAWWKGKATWRLTTAVTGLGMSIRPATEALGECVRAHPEVLLLVEVGHRPVGVAQGATHTDAPPTP